MPRPRLGQDSRYWNPGDQLPEGKRVVDCEFISIKPEFTTGSGTSNDPLIQWSSTPGYVPGPRKEVGKFNTPYLMEKRRVQVERLARQETMNAGMTHIIIRASNHDYRTGRDSVSGTKTGAYIPAPNHFTLHMSRNEEIILVSGHIYTNRDKDNIPIMVTPLEERPIDASGVPERSVELFAEGRPGMRSR